ncbi:MAG: M23 family metallopeptidase [Lachnospiraceae bacterium]|nr:M23 family metallopeptidase [Lachnospiraceae bacterium]
MYLLNVNSSGLQHTVIGVDIMDIILYKCTDETNAFPKTLTKGVTISGTLRGECDILSPVLVFTGVNSFEWFKTYNYMYIPDFGRYYFVSEMNLTSNASIEISCTIDVLQSWKDDINNLSAVVARNEFESDPYIIDDMVIMTPTDNVKLVNPTAGRDFDESKDVEDLNFIIHTAAEESPAGLPVNPEYVGIPFFGFGGSFAILNLIQIKELFNEFWNTDFLANLFTNYGEKSKMVTSLRVYPFNVTTMEYGTWQTGLPYEGIEFGNEVISISNTAPSVIKNPSKQFIFIKSDLNKCLTNSYMDYSTITEYKIFLPYIGYVDIDSIYLYKSEQIYIDFKLDLVSGILYAKIISVDSDGNNIEICSASNKVGVDIPLSGTDTTIIRDKIISTALTAVGTAGAFISPATTIATSTVGSVVSIQDRNPSTNRLVTSKKYTSSDVESKTYKHRPSLIGSSTETLSGLASLTNARLPFHISTNLSDSGVFTNIYIRPFIAYKRPERKYYDNYGHYVGYPLYKSRILNSVNGYTKVQDVHIEIPCTDTERELIDGLLKSGVLIKNSVTPDPDPEPEPEPENESVPPTMIISPFVGTFRVTSIYGYRDDEFHKGIDLVGEDTTDVTSVNDGVVDAVGWENPDDHSQGFGYRVRVLKDGVYTYYGHMVENSSSLNVGDTVSKYDKIGVMGNTGYSTGAHLHLEFRSSSNPDDTTNPYDITGIPNEIGTYKYVRS